MDNMWELGQIYVVAYCTVCGEQICIRQEVDHLARRQDYLNHFTSNVPCRLRRNASPFWCRLTFYQSFIVGCKLQPTPSMALRYWHLKEVLSAQSLVAGVLCKWQLYVDEATARHFIVDAFETLSCVNTKVERFESMMTRLYHQGYLMPIGLDWRAQAHHHPMRGISNRDAWI